MVEFYSSVVMSIVRKYGSPVEKKNLTFKGPASTRMHYVTYDLMLKSTSHLSFINTCLYDSL